MKNPNSKEIDSAKLEQILNAYCAGKGIALSDLSKETGFSRRYFADSLKRGTIRQPGINFLKRECGIDYEQYKKETDIPETNETEMSEIPANDHLLSQDIILKLDELVNAVRLLNETEKQNLEILKEIKESLL